MSALRLGTRTLRLTVNGGRADAGGTPMPAAWAALLLLVTWSCGPVVAPVSVLVPLTELLWPRLKTPPTPEPAIAAVTPMTPAVARALAIADLAAVPSCMSHLPGCLARRYAFRRGGVNAV